MKIILAFVGFATLMSFAPLKQKKKIVFFGDSITQAGVDSIGYITQLNKMLQSKTLQNDYDLVGAGVSGNKVYDLYLRMEDDVLKHKPDVVFIYVGINDVWHKSSLGTGTDADKFEKFYQAIITKLKQSNINVVLCTPTVIGERNDASNQQDSDLNFYSGIIRNLAQKNTCTIVDLRKNFIDYLKTNNPGNKEKNILTTDRVHLNKKGNALVAESMLASGVFN